MKLTSRLIRHLFAGEFSRIDTITCQSYDTEGVSKVDCKVAAVEILVLCNLQTAPAVSVVVDIVGGLTVCQYYVVSVVLFMIIVDRVQLVLS